MYIQLERVRELRGERVHRGESPFGADHTTGSSRAVGSEWLSEQGLLTPHELEYQQQLAGQWGRPRRRPPAEFRGRPAPTATAHVASARVRRVRATGELRARLPTSSILFYCYCAGTEPSASSTWYKRNGHNESGVQRGGGRERGDWCDFAEPVAWTLSGTCASPLHTWQR